MFQRACFKVLVKKVAKYEVSVHGAARVMVAPSPKPLFPRAMLHTSVLAWLAVQNSRSGSRTTASSDTSRRWAESLDRSTMCRNLEGRRTLGATIVHAMLRDAIETCSVLSTDATGAAIQPGARDGGPKRACKKGHFFTIVADRDHVLFSYVERHTQDAVASLFKGFRGYLQSDASSVYDILDRGHGGADPPVLLVGCWAHTRRYFFEAAICKYPIGVAGLTRIRAIYVADNALAHMPPIERARERLTRVLPLVDEFFACERPLARPSAGPSPRRRSATPRTRSRSSAVSSSTAASPRQHTQRAGPSHHRGRPQELALLWQRSPRPRRRRALQHRSLLPTPRPRPADLPRGP
ncbi:MAG: transposase [Myxococcales bacterium]|nr:transposase [Myxococcales bacterium]